MVLGLTNSVNISQQGGSDTVYAINQTGKDLVNGDKVWLNVKAGEDKWRATTFEEVSDLTLTGFATGNVNEYGENEISTVLPSVVTLTFNVSPEPDTLEIIGIVA